MHLSILTDCFVSDTVRDAGRSAGTFEGSHHHGVLRGLAVVAVAALLAGLTLAANFAQPAEANTGSRLAFQSSGTAVNLMHREVIGH